MRTDQLAGSPELLTSFTQHFNWKLSVAGCRRMFSPREVWSRLEELRKGNQLAMIRVHAYEDPGLPVREPGVPPKKQRRPHLREAVVSAELPTASAVADALQSTSRLPLPGEGATP